MNFKKLIALIIVSICIFNKSHSMETITAIVKNDIVPAAAIAEAGAIFNAASSCLYKKLSGYENWYDSLKKDALKGAIFSLPVIATVLLGSRESRLPCSISSAASLGSIACLAFGVPAAVCTWKNRQIRAERSMISSHFGTVVKTRFDNDEIQNFENAVNRQLFGIQLASSIVSAAVVAVSRMGD